MASFGKANRGTNSDKEKTVLSEADVLDFFSDVENSEVIVRAQNILPGNHVLEVTKTILHVSESDEGGLFFISTHVVIESDNPEMKPGSLRAFIANLSKPTSRGNVKAYFMAMAPNLKESDISKEDMAKSVGESQPLAKTRIRCESFKTENKDGDEFTNHQFSFLSFGKKY